MPMAIAETLVQDVISSVPLPETYTTIRTLVDDGSVSIRELSETVSRNPVLTERIMQLANGPLFGFPVKIDSVQHAIGILGKTQLHDLVLSSTVMHLFRYFPNPLIDTEVFKTRAIYCGLVSRLLGSLFNALDGERFFVAGLLHEIGHLILFSQLPEISLEIMKRAKESHRPLHVVERELMGYDYAEVGAELLIAWQIPGCFEETTRNHLKPAEAPQFTMETAAVHIANHMTIKEELCEDALGLLPAIDPRAWEITGLDEDVLPSISRYARFLAPQDSHQI
jgi:HD-like signal output (HDOD) protein